VSGLTGDSGTGNLLSTLGNTASGSNGKGGLLGKHAL